MKKIFLIGLLAALLAAPSAPALDRAETKALLRLAVKLSGLSAREPVRVVTEKPGSFRRHRTRLLDRAIPPSAQAYQETVYRALGLIEGGKGVLRAALLEMQDQRGVYDPKSRTAFVLAGPGERNAALHEIVHGLQDQHYDLSRLGRLPGQDARIAGLAAVEGYAALATRSLATRRTAAHGGPKLTRFLQLERGFLYSIGLRFSAELRNLGGSKAALASLRRLPATTEQVFHLDKYLEREGALPIQLPVNLAGMSLAGTGTFGELDVRALLAVFGVPRLDHAGAGWGGGRTALYRGPAGEAVAVALEWDSELDATQWAEAVAVYVNEAFDAGTPGLPATSPCAATSCWQVGARAIAFDRSERRTALVIGADLGVADTFARSLTGRS